jgi:hypothetical protein
LPVIDKGHQIVGKIAQDLLTPKAQKMLNVVLKDDAEKTLEKVSTWAGKDYLLKPYMLVHITNAAEFRRN